MKLDTACMRSAALLAGCAADYIVWASSASASARCIDIEDGNLMDAQHSLTGGWKDQMLGSVCGGCDGRIVDHSEHACTLNGVYAGQWQNEHA